MSTAIRSFLVFLLTAQEPAPTPLRTALRRRARRFGTGKSKAGLSLCTRSRRIPKIPGLNLLERWSTKTPVVVFSSSTDEQEKQRALALGARDFVSKS
jgi:CheY-like chemotaxis protein